MMSIFINGWETNLKFSAAHFIPYHSKCRRLHGHDYAIDIKITGETVNGMVMDFVVIKKELRKILESMDHKLILPLQGKDITYTKESNSYRIKYENHEMAIPDEFVFICEVEHTSSEEIARYLAGLIRKNVEIPPNVRKIEISVYEGPGQKATWEEDLS